MCHLGPCDFAVTRQRLLEALERDGARTQILKNIDFSPGPQGEGRESWNYKLSPRKEL